MGMGEIQGVDISGIPGNRYLLPSLQSIVEIGDRHFDDELIVAGNFCADAYVVAQIDKLSNATL